MASPSVLAQVPLFSALSGGEFEALVACLRRRRYAKGEVIFHQDDPGSALYVIESGEVKIVRTSPDGKEIILALLRRGDFFGELSLLDGDPRSADAVARETCQLLVLQREDFLRFLEGHPRAATVLLSVLSRRLRRTDQLVQEVALLDVGARLARTLLDLAQAQAGEAGLVVPSRLNQAELAALVGTTRESINKWLGFYERQGLLRRSKGLITILRPQELRRRIY